jgi:hypothetical protein
MARITLSGVPRFDGEYELDTESPYNGHELHLIKKVADVRLGGIEQAARDGDYDLFVAFAVIALWRAGKVQKADTLAAADLLLEAPAGSISFEDDAEADAGPPELTRTEAVGSGEPDESSTSSSEDLNGTGGVRPVTIPERTGSPGSAIGSPE